MHYLISKQGIATWLMRGFILYLFLSFSFLSIASVVPTAGQGVLQKKITLRVENMKVKNILQKIKESDSIRFAYLSTEINDNRKLSIDVEDTEINKVLEILFSTNVSLSAKRNLIIIKPAMQSTSDGTIISGKVTDENGEGLPAVNVLEKGTTNGTLTDVQGSFSLDIMGAGSVLIFSFIGYESKEVTVGTQATIEVSLKSEVKKLEEVVVTALNVPKTKDQLGFSVTNVSGAQLAITNDVNPINSLQGKVAGVNIDLGGAGGLMANSKIVIRGNSTLGSNNQPIFVIDGVILDNDTFNGDGRDFGNNLKNLNPEDFESVSVLKGSAAAALYGTRAVNGVILITTKKGKPRDGIGLTFSQAFNTSTPYAGPKFQNEFGGGSVGAFFTDTRDPNYTGYTGWETKVFPKDPATGKEYIDRQINRELENWGPRMSGQDVLNYDGTPTKYLPQPNNFLDAFQNGFGSNTNISLDNGNEKMTYRLSYNRNQADGIVRRNAFVKNSIDLRVTNKIAKFLDTDISISYADFDGKNPPRLGESADFFGGYNFGKAYSWVLPRNYDTRYWMQPAHYISQFGGVPDLNNKLEPNKAPESNFWFSLFENNYLQREQMLRGRLAFTFTLTKWAKLVVEGSGNNVYTKNETKELGQMVNFSGGSYSLGFQTKETAFGKWMFLVNKNINKDITFNGYIGGETQRYKTIFENIATQGGLVYPGNYFIANSKNPVLGTGGVSFQKRYNSLYASADFGYKDMLFLQATWRGDWSSSLTYADGSGNYFYHYPAVSLAWVFTETLKSSLPAWLSYGKLRGNIAALGGDANPFIVNPGFSLTGISYANGRTVPYSTYSSNSVVQRDLKPQRKISKELGIEMRFLNDRVGLDFSWYQDNTRRQLLDIPSPVESGIANQYINAGNIQNRGIEIQLYAYPITTSNFKWNTSFNLSRNRNKIIELYPGRTEFNLNANIREISSWAVVGGAYGVLRTQIHSESFQAKDAGGNPIPNDPRNGMPVLSWRANARTAFPKQSQTWQDVGDINPKFRAGWDNTFSYKNVTLNFLIDSKIGGDFVALSYRYGTHTGVLPNTISGRDAQSGGISWTSQYADDKGTYDDGRLVNGVFAYGQKVTAPNGTEVDVGGMTFEAAHKAGYVEPTHTPQFFYRYGSGSTAVSDYWILENSWIMLRQVALTYALPKKYFSNWKLNSVSFSIVGRDLGYLYQTLPYNFNPQSNNSNNTAYSGENGFLPKTRNFVFTIRATF